MNNKFYRSWINEIRSVIDWFRHVSLSTIEFVAIQKWNMRFITRTSLLPFRIKLCCRRMIESNNFMINKLHISTTPSSTHRWKVAILQSERNTMWRSRNEWCDVCCNCVALIAHIPTQRPSNFHSTAYDSTVQFLLHRKPHENFTQNLTPLCHYVLCVMIFFFSSSRCLIFLSILLLIVEL